MVLVHNRRATDLNRTVNIQVRLTPREHQELALAATARAVTKSQYVRDALLTRLTTDEAQYTTKNT